ncbi:MAG: transposase [Clostridiales bacterium]|nr:transposase [Clostridiales bacterium]
MPKGVPNKRYTPEFKVMVVETMRKEGASYCETARQFEIGDDKRVAAWERIYLTEDWNISYIKNKDGEGILSFGGLTKQK